MSRPTPQQALAFRHNHELAVAGYAVESAEDRISGINRVTQRAIIETMQTNLLRREAQQMVPEAGELYAMFCITAAMQSAQVINGMYRWR